MRVWFNHWFSTAYHLIELMRSGMDTPLTVIGSNSNSKAVYRQVCDEWYAEEELPDEQYVQFCLDFCKAHRVDVFVPRRGLVAICRHIGEFEAIGVKVMLERDSDMVSMLDDKIAAYRFFQEKLPEIVPDYVLAHSLEEFRQACESLKSPSGRLCYKLSVDEGARSFRVIDNSIESIGALCAKPGTKVTQRAAEAILSQYDFKIPVLVMPYLSGADVSADCMETDTGRLIIPRFKVGRYSEVKPDPEVTRLCNAVMDILRFDMPANIQFKLEQGRPWLLEINPRMSGGLQLSCLATGINLPAVALAKVNGHALPWSYPENWKTAGVVNLETPVIVAR